MALLFFIKNVQFTERKGHAAEEQKQIWTSSTWIKHTVVKFSSVKSYVDDIKVYLSFLSKDIDSCPTKVTEDLRLIAAWWCTDQLLINPSKTKLILFGMRQLLSKISDVRVPFLAKT